MEGEMIPAVYKCDVCNQVEKWHTWFEGWEGGCYEGKCESCYRASLGGTRTGDADLGRGPGTGADADSSAGQGGGDGDGQVGQAVEPLSVVNLGGKRDREVFEAVSSGQVKTGEETVAKAAARPVSAAAGER